MKENNLNNGTDLEVEDTFNFSYNHPSGKRYDAQVLLTFEEGIPCVVGAEFTDDQGELVQGLELPEEMLLREWELEKHIRGLMVSVVE